MRPNVPDEMIRTASDREAVRLGYWFDASAADRACVFFERFLRHSKGSNAPFTLLPWQRDYIIRPLIGWKRPDGTRRFRRAGAAIAKKNGKSTILAGLAAYGLIGDGEYGPEVYSAAADQQQASIIFGETANMVESSPALSSYLNVNRSRYRIDSPLNHGVFRALSADVNTKEGLNISWLLFDELHAQKTYDLWNTLKYGGAARKQPVRFWITTAGFDKASLCYEEWQHALAVQRGEKIDVHFLPYICALDESDDWTDSSLWHKANPSLGETISLEDMQDDFRQCAGNPAAENVFKRYRLNLWTEQETRWIPVSAWDACGADYDVASLWGHKARLGVDLASTTDLAAVAGLAKDDDGVFRTFAHFWASEKACERREIENRVRLENWAKQGLITICPGPVIQYDMILEYCQSLRDILEIEELCIDPWNATQFATDAAAVGFDVSFVRTGFASISASCKEFERLVMLGGKLLQNKNPVMRWMFGNVQVETDASGNIKPSKRRSPEKIDGIVALLLALKQEIQTSTYDYSKYGATGLTVL